MSCELLQFVPDTCTDARWVPGLARRVYLARRSDIISYAYDTSQNVSAISFASDTGLIRLYGEREGHTGTQEMQARDGRLIKQTLNLRLRQHSAEARRALEALLPADDLVAIVETLNGTFRLYFARFGASVVALRQSDGARPGDDSSFTLALEGAELRLIPDVDAGDAQATAALLESYVK